MAEAGFDEITGKVFAPDKVGATVELGNSSAVTHKTCISSVHSPYLFSNLELTHKVRASDDSHSSVDPLLSKPSLPRAMSSQTPSKADMPINLTTKISSDKVHQSRHVSNATLDHSHHINRMACIPTIPGQIRRLADEPCPVVRHVKRQGDKTSLWGFPRVGVPGGNGPTGNIMHSRSRASARMKQPETSHWLILRQLIETVDVDEESRHGERLFGDGGRWREALCSICVGHFENNSSSR